jgi:hypothetical protein
MTRHIILSQECPKTLTHSITRQHDKQGQIHDFEIGGTWSENIA